MSARLEGWELRLAGLVDFARARPYELGEHDCFRFACAAVEALTGAERWEAWRGRYRTQREALKLIAEYGSSFTAAFTRFFAVEPCAMPLARRGDIAEYVDDAGEHHLGVVMGAQVAVLAEGGLEFRRRELCRHAWRIG